MKRLRYSIAAATILASPLVSVVGASAFSMGDSPVEGIVVDGNAITLTKDVSACLDFTSGDAYTLNLAGYTLTAANSTCGPIALHGGSLNITTSVSGGTITNTADSVKPVINNEAGTLVIDGGNFIQKSNYNTVYGSGAGTTTINGGTFTKLVSGAGVVGNLKNAGSKINITGGDFTSASVNASIIDNYEGNTFTVTGGIFSTGEMYTKTGFVTGGVWSDHAPTSGTISGVKDGYVAYENASGDFEIGEFDFDFVDDSPYVEVGGETTIAMNVIKEPEDYNAQIAYTYKSSDTKIATVDSDGKVTGVAKGEAVITVTNLNANISHDVTVTVAEGLKSIKLANTEVTLTIGEEFVTGITYNQGFDLSNVFTFDVKQVGLGENESSIAGIWWGTDEETMRPNYNKLSIWGNIAGSATFKVTITDMMGNSAEATIKVTVEDVLKGGGDNGSDKDGNFYYAQVEFDKAIEGAERIGVELKTIPSAQAENSNLKVVLDVSVYDKNGKVISVKDNKIKIFLAVSEKMIGGEFSAIQLVYLDENGEIKEYIDPDEWQYVPGVHGMPGQYTIVFTTTHLSNYGILASNTPFDSAANKNKLLAPNTGAFARVSEGAKTTGVTTDMIMTIVCTITVALYVRGIALAVKHRK